MDDHLVTIYIEDLDGIYFAYRSKSDPYAGPKLTEARTTEFFADTLCDATLKYNETQKLLCDIYNA